jgi:hypothetical protein
MSTSKRGAKRTTRKKLAVGKQTVKDLAPQRAKGVKGGSMVTMRTCYAGGRLSGANW